MKGFFRKLWESIFLSDYYYDGWDDYHSGLDESDNPHFEGTYAFNQWEYGWTAAQDANWRE